MSLLNDYFGKLRKPDINFKAKYLISFFLFFLIISFLGLFYFYYDNLTPLEAVELSIKNSLQAESYRYKAISKRILNGEEKVLSEALGEKNQANVHFFGELYLVNSVFEYYQIEDSIYRKDPFSERWLIVEDMQRAVTEQLIQEINPLGALNFEEILEAEYLGKEEIAKEKYKKYLFRAQTTNKYLTVLWHDFSYQLWTENNRDRIIKKVEIKAQSKKEPLQLLIMTIEFTDYNREVLITPPL